MEAAELKKILVTPSVQLAFYRWFGQHAKVETSQLEASLELGYETGGA
jgi:hypothetical protein